MIEHVSRICLPDADVDMVVRVIDHLLILMDMEPNKRRFEIYVPFLRALAQGKPSNLENGVCEKFKTPIDLDKTDELNPIAYSYVEEKMHKAPKLVDGDIFEQ